MALVLVSERIGLASLLIKWSVLIVLLTLVMVAINLISYELFFGIYAFIMDKQNGIVTPERDPIGLGIGEFYYASCPIMIFSFAYYCQRMFQYATDRVRSIAMSLLFGVALLLTGARANILAMLAVAAFLMLMRIRKSAGLASTFLVGAAIIIIGAGTVLPKFANKQEGSNAIKLGHFYSYIDEFDFKPTVLLMGEGANSAFYSQGFEKWTTVTELTYLELIRIFGLPMLGLFGVGLSWIAYRLFANGFTALGLAYVGYLGIAASNPLLLNSTGFLVIAAMYEQAVKDAGPPLRLSNNLQAARFSSPNG
jgi:MFS family permease